MEPMFGSSTTSTPVKTPAKSPTKKAAKKTALRQPEAEQIPAESAAEKTPKKRAAKRQPRLSPKTKSVAQLKLYAARAVAAAQNAEKREKLTDARAWVKQLEHDGNRLAREVSANDKALIRARAVLEKLEPQA